MKKEENEEKSLSRQVLLLRRSVSSYKSANTKYRNVVEKLEKQLEENLNLMIQEKEKRREMSCHIDALNNQILEYKDKINELSMENRDLRDALEYEQKPWWKKLF